MTSKSHSGSPPPGEPEYLLVGNLRRPYGLRGQLVMEVVTDFPERLKPETQVFVGEQHHARRIIGTSAHAHGLLIQFEGVETPEKAGLLRNMGVYVRSTSRPPLPDGHYYHHQLLGLDVVDDEDRVLGHLNEILQTGANDVYVIATAEGSELLLPAIDTVVLGIDIAGRTIRVHVPEGLQPESQRPKTKRPVGMRAHAKRG